MPRLNRLAVLSAVILLSACTGRAGTQEAQDCGENLRLANQELDEAKVKGFGGSLHWLKAANLLAGASVQQQFEKYESCSDKVRRARALIQEAQK